MIYIRNAKNTSGEFYRIINLLTRMGGELVENGMEFKNSSEYFYIDFDSYKERPIIRSVNARCLKYGHIFTVDEFLSKYILETNIKVSYFDDVFKVTCEGELLCTVIRTDEQTNSQKVFYGFLEGNKFYLMKADDKEWKKI